MTGFLAELPCQASLPGSNFFPDPSIPSQLRLVMPNLISRYVLYTKSYY